MKKILIGVAVSCTTMLLHAQESKTKVQTDSIELKTIQLPDSTAIGAPDGKLVNKEIGPSGGTIASDDGKVELIFPAGALKANTVISIQPITNLLPNGSGKAYRFEPSGIRFTKPVELIFHYTEQEEKGCSPLLMFMAIQSSNGRWAYMDYEDWDSTGRYLKGNILHFSAMVNGKLAELYPKEETLKVGESHNFSLNIVHPPQPSSVETGEDELPPLPGIAPLGKYQSVWLVNEKNGGAAEFGTITPKENKSTAIYTAPRLLPLNYVVTIKLKATLFIDEEKITRAGKRKGKMITMGKQLADKVTFTSTVNLYDKYAVKVKGLWDNTNMGAFTQKWTDESSFILRVGKDPGISDVSNSLYTLVEERFTSNGCQFLYVNKETCKGVIHVAGITGVGLSGGSASTYVTAMVDFVRIPLEFPNLKITCRHGSIPNMGFPSFPALPHKMKFALKTGTYNEEYSENAVLPGGSITITLKQITVD